MEPSSFWYERWSKPVMMNSDTLTAVLFSAPMSGWRHNEEITFKDAKMVSFHFISPPLSEASKSSVWCVVKSWVLLAVVSSVECSLLSADQTVWWLLYHLAHRVYHWDLNQEVFNGSKGSSHNWLSVIHQLLYKNIDKTHKKQSTNVYHDPQVFNLPQTGIFFICVKSYPQN